MVLIKNSVRILVLFILLVNVVIYSQDLTNSDGFVSTQYPINKYYKWQEFSAESILYSYIIPIRQNQIIKSKYKQFYLKYKKVSELYFRFEPELAKQSDNNQLRFRLNGSIKIPFSNRLSIQNDFEIDNLGANDPHYMGFPRPTVGKWTGYIQQSILSWKFEKSHFLLGRGNFQFGVVNSGLLINSNHPPSEIVWWHTKRNAFSFDWGIEFLDSVNQTNRLLTFHRFGFKKDNFRIGFTEASLVPYSTLSTSELRFLMPSSILLETEENRLKNSNLIWLLDFMLKLNGLTVYGEVLLDDYSFDKLSPNKIAGKFGFGGKFNKLHYFIEYVRINRWVGNYSSSEFRFIENEVLIGHPLGPDGHCVKIGVFTPITNEISLFCDVMWKEYGSGSIEEQWPIEDAQQNFGYSTEPFPSGEIQSEILGNFQLDYFVSNNIKSTIQINCNSQNITEYRFSISTVI